MKTLNIIFAVALLMPCSAYPKSKKTESGGYGAYPTNYREIVDAWTKTSLKDPYSVRDLKVSEPAQGWVKDSLLMGGRKYFGYMLTVSLNAKNSYGAYTGIQTYNLLIRDGRVIAQQWLNQPGRAVTGPDWIFLK